MKAILRISGGLLLLFGLIWIVFVMGAVASHTSGYGSLGEVLPALAFHALISWAGLSLLSKTIAQRPVAKPQSAPTFAGATK